MKEVYKLIVIVMALVLVSCASQRDLAQECAEKYPPKDSTIIKERVVTDSVYIKGDTVEVDCPPVVVTDPATGVVTITPIKKKTKCPDKNIEYKYVVKDTVVYRENTAKVIHLESVINDQVITIAKLAEEADAKDRWKVRFFVLLFITLGLGYLRFKRII
jgi:hypothetical protein